MAALLICWRTNTMVCSICGEEIVLVPSATDRAKKYGGKPSDYTKLFTEHAQCALLKREEGTLTLMRGLQARDKP